MRKIIYDCDPGIDDALAIILALNSGELDIEGITTVHGNSSVEQTTKNAQRLLEYLGKDIPVARGAEKPLVYDSVSFKRAVRVHGEDGLGDSELLSKEPLKKTYDYAVDFIIRKVKEGVRTIVATGALTNIALAFQKEPETMNLLEEIIIMGGVINQPGNIDRLSEANFYVDPHAADYILQQSVKKILIPLNVTHQVIFTPENRNALSDTRTGKLVKSIVKKYQDFYMSAREFPGNPLHDPLAIGYAIDPLFFKTELMDVKVETEGRYTRGICVPELRKKADLNPNVNVAVAVDSARFLDYFMKTVSK